MAQRGLGGACPQRIGVGDAVAAGQGRGDERHRLGADVGVPGGIAQVNKVVEELQQAQVLGQGGRQNEPGVSHCVGVVEGHDHPVQAAR